MHKKVISFANVFKGQDTQSFLYLFLFCFYVVVVFIALTEGSDKR